MRELSTKVSVIHHDKIVSPSSKILTLGSCFADHMGTQLSTHGFATLVNPFGTLFNPISIATLIDRAAEGRLFLEVDIHVSRDRYFSFDLHTSFDRSTAEDILTAANEAVIDTSAHLASTDLLILTFGSAIAYHHSGLDRLVNNCHKVPAAKFERKLLTVHAMYHGISQSIERLQSLRPELKVILTVSPVRHTKEGLVDNNVSKGRLLDLCHALSSDRSGVSYFPAYEIMMDELRDYRYYKSDLIHPSDLAVDIIWERFGQTYFSESAKKMKDEMVQLNRAMSHRPFRPESEGHQIFCRKQLDVINRLISQYKHVDFDHYIAHFTSALRL